MVRKFFQSWYRKFLLYSLYAMPVMIPLSLWASWDTVQLAPGKPLKIAIAIGIALVVYVGGVLLFWWNGFWQKFWKQRNTAQ